MAEVTNVKKRDSEDRACLNSEMQYKIEMVAFRDKLDLEKSADKATATERALQ